jgi:hypothetical protein
MKILSFEKGIRKFSRKEKTKPSEGKITFKYKSSGHKIKCFETELLTSINSKDKNNFKRYGIRCRKC